MEYVTLGRTELRVSVLGLGGTGNMRHLEANVASILRPPLPHDIRARLVEPFARVDTISGQ